MKIIISTLLLTILSSTLWGQDNVITLKECIEKALENKANIKAVKTELIIADLQKNAAKGKYLPQISLMHEYRYNPIIPSQIVPVGQFNPVPTDETRAIQFGTNWQQNLGISLYQPIVDLSIQSSIAESKINEKIKNADLKVAEDALKYDVLKSFNRVLIGESQKQVLITDSLRTYESLSIINIRYLEGKVLKTELNKAQLNHNYAISNYRKAVSEIVKEKIYLSFLTSIELTRLLDAEFDFSIWNNLNSLNNENSVKIDSIPAYQRLNFQQRLLNLQIKNENLKYVPVLGFEGFLGANQYTQSFNPFLANSWFGTSYIGLSVKVSLLSSEMPGNRAKQLQTQTKILEFEKQDLENKLVKDLLQANEEIKQYTDEISILEQNIILMKENLILLQERFSSGLINANELNLQELELQHENNKLLQTQSNLHNKQMESIYNAGGLNAFIEQL